MSPTCPFYCNKRKGNLYNLDSRKRSMRFVMVALLVALFVGCSYRFEISIIGDDPFHPTFVLRKPPLIEPFRRGVQLNAFEVYEKESNRKVKVWFIRLPLGSYKRMHQLHYGDLPAGFEEIKAAESLAANVKYRVAGSGGGCLGSTEFEIVKEGNVYKIRTATE